MIVYVLPFFFACVFYTTLYSLLIFFIKNDRALSYLSVIVGFVDDDSVVLFNLLLKVGISDFWCMTCDCL